MENSLSKYIILTEENMAKEHICCAFSDKKCAAGYELKKEWLTKELQMVMFSDGLTHEPKSL